MKSFFTLALPTLAASAALLDTRQTPVVRVVSARSISNGEGSGCPTGHFATQMDTAANTLTLLFDKYTVAVGPGVNPGARESFCDCMSTTPPGLPLHVQTLLFPKFP